MGNEFRNLIATVLANLVHPIKRNDFSVFINFLYATLSGGTLLQSVMLQQYNCIGTVHIFHKILLFMKIHLPSPFILRYVRAKMIVHAFMIELYQPGY